MDRLDIDVKINKQDSTKLNPGKTAGLNSNFDKNKHPFTLAEISNSGKVANDFIKLDGSLFRADIEIMANPKLSKIDKIDYMHCEMPIVQEYYRAINPLSIIHDSGNFQFLYTNVLNESKSEIRQTLIVDKELGGVSGVDQGGWGDCWFESSLASLARTTQGQLAIAKMITLNKNGTYTVTFPGDKKDKIIVSNTDIKKDHLSNNAKWANILEAAVIKLCPKQVNDGASATRAMRLLTGKRAETQYVDANSKDDHIAKILEKAIKRNELLTAGSKDTLHNNSIVNDHDYTVIAYDPTTEYITLRNPFGDNANSGDLPKDTAQVGGPPVDGVLNLGNGLIAMSINTFKQNFDIIQHTL